MQRMLGGLGSHVWLFPLPCGLASVVGADVCFLLHVGRRHQGIPYKCDSLPGRHFGASFTEMLHTGACPDVLRLELNVRHTRAQCCADWTGFTKCLGQGAVGNMKTLKASTDEGQCMVGGGLALFMSVVGTQQI